MYGLAQYSDLGPAMLMLAVLLGIVLFAGGVLIWVRSRTLSGGSVQSGSGLFDDLRRMRDAGEITEEEFAAAKRSVVDRMAGRKNAPDGAEHGSGPASARSASARSASIERSQPKRADDSGSDLSV